LTKQSADTKQQLIGAEVFNEHGMVPYWLLYHNN